MPVSVLLVVRQKVVVAAAKEIVHGSVRWIPTPVSPVTPLTVRVTTFPAGGTIVQAVGVEPPVGTVMVLAPLARVLISTEAGLAALEAAERVSTPTTSPVKVMIELLVAVAAIALI